MNAESIYLLTDTMLDSSVNKLKDEEVAKLAQLRDMARSQLPADYDKKIVEAVSNPQTMELVRKSPEEAFRTTYSALDSNGQRMDSGTLKKVRGLNAMAKAELLKRNVNISGLIGKKSLVGGFWDTLVNIANLPQNIVLGALSMPLTGRGIKPWGGNAFEDFVSNFYMKDPYFQGIADKVARNEPLSPQEQYDYEGYKGTKTWLGLGLNTLPIGGGLVGGAMKLAGKGKAITGLYKAGQTVQRLSNWSDPWNVLGDISKSAKNLRSLSKMDETKVARETVNDIAKTVKAPDFLYGTDLETQKNVIQLANKVLRKTGLPSAEEYNTIVRISDALKKGSKPDLGNLVDDALAFGKKNLEEIGGAKIKMTTTKNPMVKAQETMASLGNKIKTGLLKKISAKTGTDYKYIQDLPYVKNLATKFHKEYIPPVVKLLLQPKRTRYYIQNLGFDAESDVVKSVNTLAAKYKTKPEEIGREVLRAHEKPVSYIFDELFQGNVPEQLRYLAPKAAKAAQMANGKVYHVFPKINDFLNEVSKFLPPDKMERFRDMWYVSQKMRKYYDSQLIRELTTNADTPILEFFGKEYKVPIPKFHKDGTPVNYVKGKKSGQQKVKMTTQENPFHKQMRQLQDMYSAALAKNPDHPVLQAIEGKMQNLLDKVRVQGAVAEFSKKVDPEGFKKMLGGENDIEDFNVLDKQFLNILSSNSPSKFQDIKSADFILYGTHVITDEFKRFLEQHSGNSIHSMVNDSAFTSKFGKSAQIRDKMSSQINRNKYLSSLSVDEANRLAEKGFTDETGQIQYLINGFKGKIFNEDPAAILRTRYNRGSYAIQQGLLKRNLQQMAAEFPEMFKKKVDEGEILRGNWKWIPEIGAYGHPDFARAIQDTDKFLKTGGNITGFVKIVDTVNGWVKAMMTVAKFPAFQIRNLVGNIFNSLLSGTRSENLLAGYIDSVRIMKSLFMKQPLPEIRMVGAGGRMFNTQRVLDIAMQGNVLQSGQGMEILTEMGRGLKSKLSTKEKVIRTVTMQKLLKIGAGTNQAFEDLSKLALLIARLREGDSPLKAIEIVNKHLFDYNDITSFTKDYVKRVIPFIVWMQNNLALQIYNMFSLPTRNILKGVKTLQNQDNETVINQDYMQPYEKDTVYIPTPFSKKDADKKTAPLLSMTGLVPTFDLSLLVQMVGKNNMQQILNQVSPTLKTPIELMANIDLRTGQKISKYPGDTTQMMGVPVNPALKKLTSFMQPINVIETWMGGGENLNPLGYAQQARGLSNVWEKILYQMIGKPMVYDERFKRIVASQQAKQDLLEMVTSIGADNKKLRNMYSGNQFPRKNMEIMMKDYGNALKAYEELQSRGLLANDSVVKNQLKSVGKELLKTMITYKTKELESAPVKQKVAQ